MRAFKADIDSAYRRIPIMPCKPLCVAFVLEFCVCVSRVQVIVSLPE